MKATQIGWLFYCFFQKKTELYFGHILNKKTILFTLS
jgi:hypothetical protein